MTAPYLLASAAGLQEQVPNDAAWRWFGVGLGSAAAADLVIASSNAGSDATKNMLKTCATGWLVSAALTAYNAQVRACRSTRGAVRPPSLQPLPCPALPCRTPPPTTHPPTIPKHRRRASRRRTCRWQLRPARPQWVGVGRGRGAFQTDWVWFEGRTAASATAFANLDHTLLHSLAPTHGPTGALCLWRGLKESDD